MTLKWKKTICTHVELPVCLYCRTLKSNPEHAVLPQHRQTHRPRLAALRAAVASRVALCSTTGPLLLSETKSAESAPFSQRTPSDGGRASILNVGKKRRGVTSCLGNMVL